MAAQLLEQLHQGAELRRRVLRPSPASSPRFTCSSSGSGMKPAVAAAQLPPVSRNHTFDETILILNKQYSILSGSIFIGDSGIASPEGGQKNVEQVRQTR